MINPYRRLRSADPVQTFANEAAASDLAGVLDCPIWNGVLLQNVALATTTTSFFHRLDRKPIGYLITRIRAGKIDFIDTGFTDTKINVTVTTAGTFDLWVF